MSALFKYAIVLASGLAIGLWIKSPTSLDPVAGLAPIDDASLVVDNAVARLKPESTAGAVNPTAAIRAHEDLDFLSAKRIGTLGGWQAFLAAHAGGDYVESAMAEIDKIVLGLRASDPAAAAVADRAAPASEAESKIARPSSPSEGPPHPLPEACNHGGGCRGDSGAGPSGDDPAPVANESERGKPLVEVASLMDSAAMAAAQPNASAKTGPDPGSRPRAAAPRREATASAPVNPRRREQRCALRFECHWKTQNLPPILQALLGVKTKRSSRAGGQMIADASPVGLHGR
jgi:hypothetical protein